MSIENRSLLGALLFAGAAQFILMIVIAEARYPGYNVATNALSDLAWDKRRFYTTASTAVFGAFALIGSLPRTTYPRHRPYHHPCGHRRLYCRGGIIS